MSIDDALIKIALFSGWTYWTDPDGEEFNYWTNDHGLRMKLGYFLSLDNLVSTWERLELYGVQIELSNLRVGLFCSKKKRLGSEKQETIFEAACIATAKAIIKLSS